MAQEQFGQAAATEGWDERDGKEVLYLFQGSTGGKLRDLSGAQSFYERALALNPEYARARVGIAEVQFQRSKGECSKDQVDAPGLSQALEDFRDALTASDQPAVSDVPAKVHFGLGRTYLCLSQAAIADDWAKAQAEFQQVIAAFEAEPDRIQDLAAESHGYVAVIFLPSTRDPDPAESYLRSAAEYREAIKLSRHRERKAFFYDQLGFVLGRLQDYDAADDAYAKAIALEGDPSRRAEYQEHRDELNRTKPHSP
jgi:tetratricopeptide (TPR) repeat protein